MKTTTIDPHALEFLATDEGKRLVGELEALEVEELQVDELEARALVARGQRRAWVRVAMSPDDPGRAIQKLVFGAAPVRRALK